MFKKSSLKVKLYISFSIVTLTVILISGAVFWRYYEEVVRKSRHDASMDALNIVCDRIDNELIRMAWTLKAAHASNTFINEVIPIRASFKDYFTQNPMQATVVRDIISSYLISDADSASIDYISRYNDYIRVSNDGSSKRTLSKKEIKQNQYIQDCMITNEFQIYQSPHHDSFGLDDKIVFSVARPIRDNFNVYGVLVYNKPITYMQDILQNISIDGIEDIVIMDEANSTFYSTSGELAMISESNYDRINEDINEGYYFSDQNIINCYKISNLTGWRILIHRNITDELTQASKVSWIIGGAYFVATLLLLFILHIMIKGLTTPLIELKEHLSTLEMNQDISIPKNESNNEVAILTIAIEKILNRIRQQNEQLIITKQRALDAHLEAMEAQLNPHFLYNTLSVIGSCGMEQGNDIIPKMCSELSNLLRYSITYNYKTVLLEDEIKNIKSYLYIMEMRYEHMLEVIFDIDSSILNQEVPKLVLQPIVENCFQHGFLNLSPPWSLGVKLYEDDGYWIADIYNNGIPISNDKIKEFDMYFSKLKEGIIDIAVGENEDTRMGVGLENTIMRLFLFYKGTEYFKAYVDADNNTHICIGGPTDVHRY